MTEPPASAAVICKRGDGFLVNAPSVGTEIRGAPGGLVFTEKFAVVGVGCGFPEASDWVAESTKSPSTNLPAVIAVPVQAEQLQAPVPEMRMLGTEHAAASDVPVPRDVPTTVTATLPPISFAGVQPVVQPATGGLPAAPTSAGGPTTLTGPGARVSTRNPGLGVLESVEGSAAVSRTRRE